MASAIPKPWELDPTFERRVGSGLSFNYNREWSSYNVPRHLVAGKLKKELAKQRLFSLPPVLKGESIRELKKIRQQYKKEQLLSLFQYRLENMDTHDYTRHIFASPMAVPKESGPISVNKGNGFLKVLGISEIANQIIRYLMPSARDIAAMGATCRDACVLTAMNMEVWDATGGEFLTKDFEDRVGTDGKTLENKGIRHNVLAVASMRPPEVYTTTPYSSDWKVMQKFFQGVLATKNSFRDVIIDQLPFFDVRLFELMIQTMPNLETVAISRCLLFDVTKLGPLIEAIKRHPRGTLKGKKQYVRVDFAPYFFDGPNIAERRGSFGVTYHEPTFHTPKAVIALMLRHMDDAQQIGMDLTSDSSGFWRFVSRLPGPDILWTQKARDAIYAYMRANRTRRGFQKAQSGTPKEQAFADDITAAVAGDNIEPVRLPGQLTIRRGIAHTREYWREKKPCVRCDHQHFRSFLTLQENVCWGCEMVDYVEKFDNNSHFRYRLIGVIDFLLADVNPERATLADLTERGHKIAEFAARDTDYAWAHHLLKETGSGVTGEPGAAMIGPYPELPNADRDGASIRRMATWRADLPKVDFRQGGPQMQHPARNRIGWSEFTSILDGAEHWDLFKRRWTWTDSTTDSYAQAFDDATRDPSSSSHRSERDHREAALAAAPKPKQREFVRRLQFTEQNLLDRNNRLHYYGIVDDNVKARIGPARGFWAYNRDSRINTDAEDYRPYNDGLV